MLRGGPELARIARALAKLGAATLVPRVCAMGPGRDCVEAHQHRHSVSVPFLGWRKIKRRDRSIHLSNSLYSNARCIRQGRSCWSISGMTAPVNSGLRIGLSLFPEKREV